MVTHADDLRTRWEGGLGGRDLATVEVGSGGEALAVVRQKYLDGVVVDLRLDDISAVNLIDEIQAEINPAPPVIVCGAPGALAEVEGEIRRLARQGVIRYAESPERPLEATVLLLDRAEGDLSA